MWNCFCSLFIIVSSVMLSIFIWQRQNEYVSISIAFLWFAATPVIFWLMDQMKKRIEFFLAPFIKYGIKWVFLAILEELTPPGKCLFLKLLFAIYITAVICKLKSGEGGAGINARRVIKFLALHCAWAAYKCLTSGGLSNGGFNIGGQDIIASVIFLLPAFAGIVAVKGWGQVLKDFINLFGVGAWQFSFLALVVPLGSFFMS